MGGSNVPLNTLSTVSGFFENPNLHLSFNLEKKGKPNKYRSKVSSRLNEDFMGAVKSLSKKLNLPWRTGIQDMTACFWEKI